MAADPRPAAPGLAPISQARAREVVRVGGRVTALTVLPLDEAPSLRATVSDDTGQIDAVFLGRRAIPGLEPGREVVLEGRVYEQGVERCLFNPRYELRAPR